MDAELIAGIGAAHLVLSKLTTKPLAEVGEILADRVRTWRFKNQLSILAEAQAYAKKRGLQIKPVQLKTLLPLLDGASLEEQRPIRELWARLLINAGNFSASQHTANLAIELLRALCPDDAKLLDVIFKAVSKAHEEERMREKHAWESPQEYADRRVTFDPYVKIPRSKIINRSGFSQAQFEMCFDNISRFNIIEYSSPDPHNNFSRVQLVSESKYAFSRLGWSVMVLIEDAASVPES